LEEAKVVSDDQVKQQIESAVLRQRQRILEIKIA
jgi:hypothetical protein